MNLNHINLVVPDVAGAVRLFEQHFGFTCNAIKGDNIVAILKNDQDFTLVIMADKTVQTNYPDAFHIGFMLDSEAKVISVHEALHKDGIPVGEGPRKIRDSFGFYFSVDGVMIEVGHYLA